MVDQLYAIMATGETWPLSFVGDESWAWWYSSEAWVLGKSDSVITPKGSLFVEIIAWFVIVVT